MAHLQVGFHDQKRVLKVKIDRKNNEIINRLEKTRLELNPDFKVFLPSIYPLSANCRSSQWRIHPVLDL